MIGWILLGVIVAIAIINILVITDDQEIWVVVRGFTPNYSLYRIIGTFRFEDDAKDGVQEIVNMLNNINKNKEPDEYRTWRRLALELADPYLIWEGGAIEGFEKEFIMLLPFSVT